MCTEDRMNSVLGLLLPMAVLMIGTGCANLPRASKIFGISVTKSKPFHINTDNKQGWGHYSFGILQEYEKDLMVVHYCTEGDNSLGPFITVDEEGQYLPAHRLGRGPSLSRDRGKTWVTARPVYPGLGIPRLSPSYPINVQNPAYFHSMFYFPDGRKLVFAPVVAIKGGNEPYHAVASAIYRDADGRWHGPIDSWFDLRGPQNERPDFDLYLTPRGVVMPDGSLVTAGYTRWKNKYNKHSVGYVTLAFRSTDGGKTFERLSIIATENDAPWGNDGPCEPAIALMPDGDLLCVMRTGDTRNQGKYDAALPMLEARSSDGGRTWNRRKLTIPGVMPKLLVMHDNTVVLATGRPGNTLFFSRDAGRTWIHEVAVTPANLLTSGYIDILEVEPGRLLATFDIYNSPLQTIWLWEPTYVNGILGMFIDVKTR